MTIFSCGIVIKSNDFFLLGHITQDPSYIFNPKDRSWTIPKGMMNPNETYKDTAIRETLEETGFDLSKETLTELSPTKKHNGKIIIPFLYDIKGKLTYTQPICNSLIINPYKPSVEGLPELDMFAWFTKQQAISIFCNSQISIFENIYNKEK